MAEYYTRWFYWQEQSYDEFSFVRIYRHNPVIYQKLLPLFGQKAPQRITKYEGYWTAWTGGCPNGFQAVHSILPSKQRKKSTGMLRFIQDRGIYDWQQYWRCPTLLRIILICQVLLCSFVGHKTSTTVITFEHLEVDVGNGMALGNCSTQGFSHPGNQQWVRDNQIFQVCERVA